MRQSLRNALLSLFFLFLVLERPSSQMSYLDHFLKESAGGGSSSSNATHTPLAAVRFSFIIQLLRVKQLSIFSNIHHPTQHRSVHHSRTTMLSQPVHRRTILCRICKRRASRPFRNSIPHRTSYKPRHSRNKRQLMPTPKTIPSRATKVMLKTIAFTAFRAPRAILARPRWTTRTVFTARLCNNNSSKWR